MIWNKTIQKVKIPSDTWHSTSSLSEHIRATISVSGVIGTGQPTRGEDKRESRECSTYVFLLTAMKNIIQWIFDISLWCIWYLILRKLEQMHRKKQYKIENCEYNGMSIYRYRIISHGMGWERYGIDDLWSCEALQGYNVRPSNVRYHSNTICVPFYAHISYLYSLVQGPV